MNSEQILWKGTPSQVLNLPALILGLLAGGVLTVAALLTTMVAGPLVIPAIIAVWVVCLFPWLFKMISTRFDNYELTNERLKHSSGVFSRNVDVLELYRVKDMKQELPFHFRIFGLGRILLETSDRSTPAVVLNAIHQSTEVADLIRRNVEAQRDKKRVREVDLEDDEEDGEA
jgi:uncharacterized membrane protein YdbT with pleckstrin-like domain